MPKAPKTKPKRPLSSAALKSSAPKSSAPKSSPSKETLLEILVAKLEDSRSFDWHGLSETLCRGKSPVDKPGLSGSELREIFYETILPALRQGSTPWETEGAAGTSEISTPPPLTPGSSTIAPEKPTHRKSEAKGREGKARAAEEEEGKQMDDFESEKNDLGRSGG